MKSGSLISYFIPMSHIGKQPIAIPAGVTVTVNGDVVEIKGAKSSLNFKIHRSIKVEVKDNQIVCSIVHEGKQAAALWGTTRARLANMVTGLSTGFTKVLELHGVGYRAALKGKDLELNVGFSHPVKIDAPEGVTFTVTKENITISGFDNQVVGQVAADIRAIRPPEPYKGKGIHYAGEKIRRKVGKVVGTTTA